MSRVLLSVGCNSYIADAGYDDLYGAETDARRMHEALVTPNGDYDSDASKLLLSPTGDKLNECINALFDVGQIDVLTIYFAGHGEVKGDFCYLCPSDARRDRLSATALSLTILFNKLSELRPRQVNLIMDSCQAGGAMLDMGNLLKPENLTDIGSPSISFLAACSPDQFAGEYDEGGVATSALTKYLTGDEVLREDRPYLDLVELGRAISAEVSTTLNNQTPVTWGLNLYGWGEFAKNPHFVETEPGRLRPPVSIAPGSPAGDVIERHSEDLWRQYQSLVDTPSYRDLSDLLRRVCEELSEAGESAVPFVRGLATSLRTRAQASNDLLAESDVLSCCAVALLPFGEDADSKSLTRELLFERRSVDASIRVRLMKSLEADRFALLDPSAAMGDFFYLPIRVSKILGWLASGMITDVLLGASEGGEREVVELSEVVVTAYRGSLVSMTDEQAPHVYLFAAACRAFGWEDLAQDVLGHYFESLESVAGMVARANLEPRDAAAYVLLRAAGGLPAELRLLAGPSQLLPGLLLPGAHLGMADKWNGRLHTFDDRYMDFFLPEDYGEFGFLSITNGTNFDPRLGHGIWTLDQLRKWFEENREPEIDCNETVAPAETKAACLLASYLLPDRMPYFLETALP